MPTTFHLKVIFLKKCLAGAVSLMASVLLLSCATDAVTGQTVFNYYTLDQEVALGRQTVEANTEQLKEAGVGVNEDPEMVRKLQRMVDDISAVSDLPNLPYSVTLYHTNIVNAAAAPGGSMFVFEGLYDSEEALVHDDDELAAVMAHEIAHVTSRHVTERLSQIVPLAILAEVGAQALEADNQEGWADFLRISVGVGTALYIPSYTRKNEYEADRVGMMYLARAGYDPRAAIRIWKRVTEKTGKTSPASIFATHPSSHDRYRALESHLPRAMEAYRTKTGRYPDDYTPGARL